ncbi:MAG: tyrosine-type recombinase/integrase [Ferrovibrio sp.]
MVRFLNRLKALHLSKMTTPGMYPDGGGLYLQVSKSGTQSWVYRYGLNGRNREMGLGPLSVISLAEARALAVECRKLRQAGTDPIDARKDTRKAQQREAKTFQVCAETYIETHAAGWRNAKHADQWRNTFSTYVWKQMGATAIDKVTTDDVLKVLEPIWKEKTETASRLRGRIEAVLDWATARGYRSGNNPARWRGHLDNLLPPPSRVKKVAHHPALPYGDVATFIASLAAHRGTAADALEFTILTACRTSEVAQATWTEVNLGEKVWIIPAHRMKSGREHRVPLSARAVDLLKRLKADAQTRDKISEYVFPSANLKKPMSNMAMLKLLDRMDRGDITVHGFRSTFRDWAAECTNASREVAEMALAHVVKDKVEAAYRRGDLFEKRRILLEEWSSFCSAATETKLQKAG